MHNSKILYDKGLIKNLKMLTQSQITESQIRFVARMDNIKLFYSALKSVHFHNDVMMGWSDNGLKAVVQDAKYLQGTVYVNRSCFSEYNLLEDTIIRINLAVLCDCLSIFANSGVDCSMKMIYKGDGSPLILILEQHGSDDLVTECSIKTKTYEEPLEFTMNEDDGFNTIILRGTDFATLLNEVNKSAEELEIFMSPRTPYFRITVLGVVQSESKMEVAKTSEMIITFACENECSNKYRMSHIRNVMKSLLLANKVAIRTDSSGLLNLQLMMGLNSQIHTQFFVTPLVNDLAMSDSD